MSAKHRGGPSVEGDSYPTPAPYIRALLGSLPEGALQGDFLDRCSFTARPEISSTDAADYAWMTYGPHHTPTVSRREVGK